MPYIVRMDFENGRRTALKEVAYIEKEFKK